MVLAIILYGVRKNSQFRNSQFPFLWIDFPWELYSYSDGSNHRAKDNRVLTRYGEGSYILIVWSVADQRPLKQCCGSGSGSGRIRTIQSIRIQIRIRTFFTDPDLGCLGCPLLPTKIHHIYLTSKLANYINQWTKLILFKLILITQSFTWFHKYLKIKTN